MSATKVISYPVMKKSFSKNLSQQQKYQIHQSNQQYQFQSTNQILSQYNQQQKDLILFLPAYLRIKIKNFTDIDIQKLKGQIDATLIFTIKYQNLPPIIIHQIQSNLVLKFQRDQALKLQTQNLDITFKNKTKQKQLHYTVRKKLITGIFCDIFNCPFQMVNLLLSITIRSIFFNIYQKDSSDKESKKFNGLSIKIKFNLMDLSQSQKLYIKLSYSQQNTFGYYRLAQAKRKVIYANDYYEQDKKLRQIIQNSKKQQNLSKVDKIKNFHRAHFIIPLYRLPKPTILTIFLPFFTLSFINLGIFFQSSDLGNRIASIATVLLALFSLIGTIRQNIPPSQKITILQYQIASQIFVSLLVLGHSLLIKDISKYNQKFFNSYLFLLALIITLCNIGYIFYKFKKFYLARRGYHEKKQGGDGKIQFNSCEWKNQNCDQYFKKMNSLKKFEDYRQIFKYLYKEKQFDIYNVEELYIENEY